MWVTTSSDLLRIDPARVKKIADQPFAFARAPVYTRGSLWLIADNEIQRIDPITLKPREVESTGRRDQPASLAAGDGALWVVDFSNGKLTRLTPGSGRTASVRVGMNLSLGRLPSSNNLSAVAVGGGSTWVAVSAGH